MNYRKALSVLVMLAREVKDECFLIHFMKCTSIHNPSPSQVALCCFHRISLMAEHWLKKYRRASMSFWTYLQSKCSNAMQCNRILLHVSLAMVLALHFYCGSLSSQYGIGHLITQVFKMRITLFGFFLSYFLLKLIPPGNSETNTA